MAELKADVLVLGAGMVGVSAALHLQQRGRDVILVDKHPVAGEETSFGNAGLIECASVFPYMFPRDFGQILQYALNRTPQVHYRLSDLPVFLPWLLRYFLASSPARAMHSAMAELPLIRRSLIEHEVLMAEAGVPELLRRTGWLKLFRSDATLAIAARELERAKHYGVAGEVLDGKAIAAREPNLSGEFAGAVYLPARVEHSIGIVTALLPTIGYEKATAVAKEALDTGRGVYEIVMTRGLLTREQLDRVLNPETMTGTK